jgi:hypothetical protein
LPKSVFWSLVENLVATAATNTTQAITTATTVIAVPTKLVVLRHRLRLLGWAAGAGNCVEATAEAVI